MDANHSAAEVSKKMILYNCIEKVFFIMKRLPGGGIKVFNMGEGEDPSKSERNS